MLERGAAGLLLSPGMGKTAITLGTFKILQGKKLARKMLVIAPLRPCYLVWPVESKKWTDFSHLKIGVLHGPDKLNVLHDTSVDIHVINPEGLEWLTNVLREMPKQFQWPWEVLVVDESTKFKNTSTKRFKLLKPMLDYFSRRYILTGTFAPNGLMDIFGQMYVLDQGHALGLYITHYRQQYFYPSGFLGYEWKIQPGAEEKIYARIAPLVLRMSAEDWLDMPGRIENIIWVDLPKPARDMYKVLEDDLFIKLDADEVSAVHAAALTTKLRQVSNGGVYTSVGTGDWLQIHDAKTDALVELLEELQGEPALIAYEFKHDLERIKKALGENIPVIGSGVPPKQEKMLVDKWNNRELPYLIANPASVSHGLNLQYGGRAVIWYGITWNLEDYEQFIDRVWRQGQTGNIIIHHILARDTIDLAMWYRIQSKDKTQRALMNALKGYRKG